MTGKQPATAREMAAVETIIGRILRVGVIVSAVIMAVGLLIFLVTGQTGYPGTTLPLRLGAILLGTLQMKAYAVMMLGLYGLILTPVLRVVVSIYAFYRERDHLYVGITTTVLVILVTALVIGIYGK